MQPKRFPGSTLVLGVVLALAAAWLITAQQSGESRFSGTLYLHRGATLFLDAVRPAGAVPFFEDSPILDGETFQIIGAWSASPFTVPTTLQDLGLFTGWVGLADAESRAPRFELRVEVLRNDEVIAAGLNDRLNGLQPPGGQIREATATFGSVSSREFAAGDVLSVRLLARLGDRGRTPPAARLRVYYDSAALASGLRVTLATANTAPVANAGPDQSATVGDTVTLDGSGSSDADGDTLTFSWSFLSRPTGSTAMLSDSSAVKPTFLVDRPGTYEIRLVVNDGQTSSAADIVIVSTVNSRPVANAGPDQTATLTSTVTLNGTGSTDPDGDTLSYAWSFVEKPAASAATLQNPTSPEPSFVVDASGDFVVGLVVNDGSVDSDPDTVTISTVNSPPVANPGPDRTAAVGDLIALDGSGSTDVDGDVLTYRWSFASRPAGSDASFSDPFSVNTGFVIDVFGDYVVQLVVNDGTVDSAPATATISTSNSPPVADAGSDQRVAVGTIAQVDGAGSSDPDGNLLLFSWSILSKPAGSDAELSSASVASPTFTVDRAGSYVLQLVVNDGIVNSAPDTVTVSTENRPPVADAGGHQTVPSGATVFLTGAGSSDPDGDPLTFSWALLSKPAGSAAALSDETAVSPTFVADEPGTYVAQLIVNDGELDSLPATVTVSTNNSAPVADAGPPQSVPAGSLVQLDGSASFDGDGSPLSFTWSLTTVPQGSSATLSSTSVVDPLFVADLRGTYVATLVVSDGSLASDPSTVEITATNRAPVARDDFATTNGLVVVSVLANDSDPDNDPLTVTDATEPANGNVAIEDGTTISYTPAPGFSGNDSFTYTISDGQGGTATADVVVTVIPIVVGCPHPVITSVDPLSGPVGTEVTILGTGFDCGNLQRLTLDGSDVAITLLAATGVKTFIPIGGRTGFFALSTDGGTATADTEFSVTPSQEFSLTLLPAGAQVVRGSFTTYAVRLSGDFAGLATMSATGLPQGASASFAPAFLTAGQTGILTIATSGETPLGDAGFDVHAGAEVDGRPAEASQSAMLSVLAPGSTALAGSILDTDGMPIKGVALRLGGIDAPPVTITDEAGNFLALDLTAGSQLLLIDGEPASDELKKYPTIPVTVVLTEGVVNRLPYQPYLHAQKNTNFTDIDPSRDTIVTDPELPGVMMRIPAGVQIIGWDGLPNEKVSMRTVPADRLPIEAPPVNSLTGIVYMFYFGKVGGGTPTQPIPFTVPNTSELEPGEQVDLWYYDESPTPRDEPNEWRVAGTSTVSADGTSIATDSGVGIPRFCCGAVILARRAATRLNQLGGLTPQWLQEVLAADPVDLSTGIFMFSETDMAIPGRMPIHTTRIYRSGDAWRGPFGVGTWSPYSDLLPMTAPGVLSYVYRARAVAPFLLQPDGTYTNDTVAAFKGTRITINPSNNYRTMTHRDGRTLEFDSAGYMTGMSDVNGNRVSVARTWGLTPDRIVDASGRLLSFTKSGDRIASVSDALGNTVRYEYDGLRLARVTRPDGSTTQYAYDSLHRMTSITDGRGITYVRNTYDVNSRVCRQELADGGVYTFYYITMDDLFGSQRDAIAQAAAGGPVTVTPCSSAPAPGRVMVTVVVDPTGTPTTYRFNSYGYLTSVVDGGGRTTVLEREGSANRVRAITDPLGRRTVYAYDFASGNLIRVTDPAGSAWQLGYQAAFSRLTSVTDPLGNVTTFEYDAKGNLTAITDAEQNRKPAGERLKTTIAYDAFGQPIAVTDPLGSVTTATYDGDGNVVSVTEPSGAQTTRTYDLISRLLTYVDGRGKSVSFEYDRASRIVATIDAVNGVTRYGYDGNGNLLTLQDARGNVTGFSYDTMDRLASRIDPLGRSDVYAYDPGGRMTAMTSRNGHTTTFQYDSLGRPAKLQFGDGSAVEYTFDAADRLVRLSDSIGGATLFSYDMLDRLTGATTTLGSVQYGYDALGRRVSMRASGQPPVSYGFDANSLLTSVTQGSGVVSIGYDALQRRTSLVLPNGVTTEYQYDVGSQLTQQIFRNAAGMIGNLTYQYDRAGNRRGVGGTLARTLLPDAVASAQYDSANRQLQFGASSMLYDQGGNLTTLSDQTGVTTFTWDARQRLVGLSGAAGQAVFGYDPFGRRHLRQIGGMLKQTLFDGPSAAVEQGSSTDSYLSSPQIDEPWVRNNSEFYLADALGSIVALTNGAGALTTRYAYDPFGRTIVEGPPSSNPFQFTGRENDGTGMYFYRARYYSPQRGRFISEDPLGFGGGDANVYAYVGNSPVSFVDPMGLEKVARDLALDWLKDKAAEIANISKKTTKAVEFFDNLFKCQPNGGGTNLTSKSISTTSSAWDQLAGDFATRMTSISDCVRRAAAQTISPLVQGYQNWKRNREAAQNTTTNQAPATPPPTYPRELYQNGYYFWETSQGYYSHWRRYGEQSWHPASEALQ